MQADELRQEEERWRREVYRGDREPEITGKVIAAGLLIGVGVVALNIYMGLKIGWGEGGSIIAVIVGFSIYRILRARYGLLENNMTQTMASAAGSIASGGLVNVIPAMTLLGFGMTGWQIFGWMLGVSLLGCFFAIPLRKQIVVMEKLRFPTGTACAETLQTLHSTGETAALKARTLGIAGAVAALITLCRDGIGPYLQWIPQLTRLPGKFRGYELSSLGIGWAYDPLLLAIGLLVGPRVSLSMLGSGLFSFLLLGPWLLDQGWVESASGGNIRDWTMWAGTMLMVTSGLVTMAFKWRLVVAAFRSLGSAQVSDGDDDGASSLELPRSTFWIGVAGSSLLVLALLKGLFGVPFLLGLVAIALSFVLAAIAVRAIGETDINPVGAMGHVTQIVYGAAMPGNMSANLMTASVTAAGASEAGDMMQDLKTGYLVGATPRKQTYLQLIGVLFGAAIAAPMYLAVVEARGIANAFFPAPAAVSWKNFAELLSNGFASLPTGAAASIVIACLVGAALSAAEELFPRAKPYLPSPIGVGVAMILPGALQVTVIGLGGVIHWLLKVRAPRLFQTYNVSVASGLLAGAGIMGTLAAIATVVYQAYFGQ